MDCFASCILVLLALSDFFTMRLPKPPKPDLAQGHCCSAKSSFVKTSNPCFHKQNFMPLHLLCACGHGSTAVQHWILLESRRRPACKKGQARSLPTSSQDCLWHTSLTARSRRCCISGVTLRGAGARNMKNKPASQRKTMAVRRG